MLVSNSRYIMILEQEYFILFQQSFKLICKFASTKLRKECNLLEMSVG